MHDLLFGHQRELDEASIRTLASRIPGFDPAAFGECLTVGMSARVYRDAATARTLGVTGTPSFFVGPVDGAGRVTAQRAVSGAAHFQEFKAVIDDVLRASSGPS